MKERKERYMAWLEVLLAIRRETGKEIPEDIVLENMDKIWNKMSREEMRETEREIKRRVNREAREREEQKKEKEQN